MRSPVGPRRAELGDTDDPAALVPGDPKALLAYAELYREASSGCGRAADGLAPLRQADGWEGESADAFAQRVSTLVRAWDDLAEKLKAGAAAWEQYATVLGWAQQKAGDAIAMFAHAAALTAAASASDSPAQLGPRGYVGAGTRASPDPGRETRSDARSLLAYARESVAAAGAEAASTLRSIAPSASGVISGNALGSLGNALLEHPDALLQITGGGALMTLGGVVFGGGVAADATVAGAAVGVPANAIGAAAMAGGAALAGAGVMNAVAHASGDGGSTDVPASKGPERDVRGRFTGKGGRPWEDKEKQGLDEYEAKEHVEIIRGKVQAHVEGGNPNGRYFDGLVRNDDGTYSAIEIKSGSGTKTRAQRVFDTIVNSGTPATARLNGDTIEIVEVIVKEVD